MHKKVNESAQKNGDFAEQKKRAEASALSQNITARYFFFFLLRRLFLFG